MSDVSAGASDTHNALAGERLGGFLLTEKLSSGGAGVLYRALDEQRDDDVALRVIRPDLISGERAARGFIDAAVSAAQLEHAGIVPIRKIGYDEQRDLYFVVSEFVPGETLAELAGRFGRLDPVDVARIGAQVCDALAVAHTAGVVHGGIHAGQLIVAPVGDVKLTDFGLRRTMTDAAGNQQVLGSPQSMAPEQFQTAEFDARSDIYSLGATLYRLAAGRAPHLARGAGELIQALLTKPAQRLEQASPDVPASLGAVVDRMIERAPADRYASAALAAEAFREVLRDLAPEPRWCAVCQVETTGSWDTCVRCGNPTGPAVRLADAHGPDEPDQPTRTDHRAPIDDDAPTELESAPSEDETRTLTASESTAATVPSDDLDADLGLRLCDRVEHEGVQRPSLGGIALLREIGRGGMGVVYDGIDTTLHRRVAVKVLPTGHRRVSEQRIYAERFMREARLAALLNSPHVVGVHAFGNDLASQLHYIVMPFIDGPTAHAWARSRQPEHGVSEIDALTVAIAAATGLSHAHAQGIVHRDVKPDNILIPRAADESLYLERAMLADLGLGRLGDTDSSLTATGQGMGTPGYMSPEQIGDASSVGVASDIFSLGATLYAVLTGSSPFKTAGNWVMNTMSGGYPKLAQRRPDVGFETSAIIAKCLRFDASERFTSAQDLVDAMQMARSHLD